MLYPVTRVTPFTTQHFPNPEIQQEETLLNTDRDHGHQINENDQRSIQQDALVHYLARFV